MRVQTQFFYVRQDVERIVDLALLNYLLQILCFYKELVDYFLLGG